MARTMFHRIPGSAVAALTLLLFSAMAAEARALTQLPNPGQTGAHGARSAESAPAPGVILAGFERRHSLYRPRSIKRARSLHGSRHARASQRFLSKNSDRFHLRRQFRGQRDFSSSVNIRVLRRERAFQNPKIINSRSLPLVRGRAATSRSLIVVKPPIVLKPGRSRGGPDHRGVRVLRGAAPGPATPALLAKAPYKPVPLPVLKPSQEAPLEITGKKSATGPQKEYGFSAY